MTNRTKWILSGVAALLVAGLIYTTPVVAAGRSAVFSAMGMMNGDMAEMHSIMAPLMAKMPAMHDRMMSEMGTLFGMTGAELTQAVSGGKSLQTIAAEKNVPIGEVRATKIRGMQAFLDSLVADGSLTQAQAGRLMAHMAQNLDSCLSGAMHSGMMGTSTMQQMHSLMMGGSR